MKAILMLEDGKSFIGEALGSGESIGRLALNTAVVGYQEMLTDPANAGKILALTYPLIGNYGCAPKFNESSRVWAEGLVIKEKTRLTSNWQAQQSFDDFVKERKLPLICGIDTRALAVHLRQKGEIYGAISTQCGSAKELLAKIAAREKEKKESRLPEVGLKKPLHCGRAGGKKIAVLDLGLTKSILAQLEKLGLNITVVPYYTSAAEILRAKPKGLVISGGPEQDPGLGEVIERIKPIIGKIPLLGISTGHQVVALALGVKLARMRLGHRGVNYPLQRPDSYKGEITSQNHGWCVDADSLAKIKAVKITSYNLNDRSVEEMESKKLKILGAQYLPVSPGLGEVNALFKRFVKMME
jgi:carbamoyl-phosphate synthase small subunit